MNEKSNSLKLRNIHKCYASKTLLADVDYDFSARIYTLSGENGSGKTTLLKIMAQRVLPDEGAVIFGKGAVSYISDDIKLYDHLTGTEHILLAQKLIYAGNAQKNGGPNLSFIDTLFTQAELESRISTYSKGMIQKLRLLLGLLKEPTLLLLDEPIDGLDENAREIVRDFLEDYATKGNIVILVSHTKEILDWGHISLRLHKGKLTEGEN
jgi:ABC-2 type transport system ATP-binding protein